MSDTLLAPHTGDLGDCGDEPIHIPGAILPHGAMLVLDRLTLEVQQVAGDLVSLLGTSADALLGQPITQIFTPDQVARLRALVASQDLSRPRHLLDPVLRVAWDKPLDASLHCSGGALVLEFEKADLGDRLAVDPLAGVEDMVKGLEADRTLHGMCHIVAERVRGVTGYDRVLVYRFMPDASGWVIAEAREPHLEPFLDLHYPAADIPEQARVLYAKNWLRLITQVDYAPAPLTPQLNPRTLEPLNMSQAILRDVSPVHRQYLRNMGIDASMSISIVRDGQLWGLIACHHYSPRNLPRHLRAVLELFGSMVSLQLQARERAEQFEERLASRMVLQNLMLNLASADDYAVGLTQQSPNLLDYIQCGEWAPGGAQQGGVAVSINGQITFLGATPTQAQIEALVAWLNTRMRQADLSESGGMFSTDRLGEIWPEAAAFADVASGVLVISVSQEPSDYIIWFRPELVHTARWAGAPVKLLEGERRTPRRSFEVWKETVRGRSQAWIPAELDAAFDLRVSLLHVVLGRINAAARERRHAAERDQLLMAELDHRVKNTIANIQALVVQTGRSADTLTGFVEGLDGRIQALGKAHSLLSQSRWEGVSMDRLLRQELDPYASFRSGVELNGVDVTLTPKSALSVSLAVHELATNAAKFGALSRPGGSVSVTWDLAADGGIALSWRERGGPMVEPPQRRGFGSTLIERALAMETGGHAKIAYLRNGVTCDVVLPASSVAANAPIILPLVGPLAAVISASAAFAESFRILVVEDSFLLVMSLEVMFDDLGWQVVGPATRIAEALALAAEASFDAALLDVNLDGAMAWDVAAILRGRALPFVFSTGYDVTSILPPDLAGSEIIGKPFHPRDLEQSLRRVIAASRARQTPARA